MTNYLLLLTLPRTLQQPFKKSDDANLTMTFELLIVDVMVDVCCCCYRGGNLSFRLNVLVMPS